MHFEDDISGDPWRTVLNSCVQDMTKKAMCEESMHEYPLFAQTEGDELDWEKRMKTLFYLRSSSSGSGSGSGSDEGDDSGSGGDGVGSGHDDTTDPAYCSQIGFIRQGEPLMNGPEAVLYHTPQMMHG